MAATSARPVPGGGVQAVRVRMGESVHVRAVGELFKPGALAQDLAFDDTAS